MARRSSRPKAGSPVPSACPCGTGDLYPKCCGRWHSGAAEAPTAEALMRSRYAAFVRRDVPYLVRTWHPDTCPALVECDPATRWTGLTVLDTTGGSGFHREGTVSFRAGFVRGGKSGAVTETSRFVRVGAGWRYVDDGPHT